MDTPIENNLAYQYVSGLVIRYQDENNKLKIRIKQLEKDYKKMLLNRTESKVFVFENNQIKINENLL